MSAILSWFGVAETRKNPLETPPTAGNVGEKRVLEGGAAVPEGGVTPAAVRDCLAGSAPFRRQPGLWDEAEIAQQLEAHDATKEARNLGGRPKGSRNLLDEEARRYLFEIKGYLHPHEFLLSVMSDPGTRLDLRVQVAQGLMPYHARKQPQQLDVSAAVAGLSYVVSLPTATGQPIEILDPVLAAQTILGQQISPALSQVVDFEDDLPG